MKKLNNTFAAAAVALGISLTPHAHAITLEPDGLGDALLFPVYNGYVENYFTVSNHSNLFVQGHLRFRGAAWSGEWRDFDVILTPGDVLVFRVADLDGDGYWEIDQSLDVRTSAEIARGDKPMTFENNAIVFADCGQEPNPACVKPKGLLMHSKCPEEGEVVDTTNMSSDDKYLIASCEYQRRVGYVEFIGEAVLDNMTHAIMKVLVDGGPTVDGKKRADLDANWGTYVTEQVNKRRGNIRSGTSAWKWADAEPEDTRYPDDTLKNPNGTFNVCNAAGTNNPCNRGLSDVGNWLSGTAFITIPGQSHGISYNAQAFNNFRTANFAHRVDNYVYSGGVTRYTNDFSGLTNNGNLVGLRSSVLDVIGAAGISSVATNSNPVLVVSAKQPTAVILHHENALESAEYPYIYGCYIDSRTDDYIPYPGVTRENYDDEIVISFNNTWGPTLADGDDNIDTNQNPLVPTELSGSNDPTAFLDKWDGFRANYGTIYAADVRLSSSTNSIFEIENAISESGQVYYSYYFDNMPFDQSSNGGKSTLKSHYFGFFPTKFYYGESLIQAKTLTCQGYRDRAIERLLFNIRNNLHTEVWNTNEDRCLKTTAASENFEVSPVYEIPATAPATGPSVGYELSYWNIDWLKETVGGCQSDAKFDSGRVVSAVLPATSGDFYPGLLFTFDQDTKNSFISHWRAMQR